MAEMAEPNRFATVPLARPRSLTFMDGLQLQEPLGPSGAPASPLQTATVAVVPGKGLFALGARRAVALPRWCRTPWRRAVKKWGAASESVRLLVLHSVFVLIAVVIITTTLFVIQRIDKRNTATRKELETGLAENLASHLLIEISNAVGTARAQAGFVMASMKSTPNMSGSKEKRIAGQFFSEYDSYATSISSIASALIAIAIAPGGVVTQMLPALPQWRGADMFNESEWMHFSSMGNAPAGIPLSNTELHSLSTQQHVGEWYVGPSPWDTVESGDVDVIGPLNNSLDAGGAWVFLARDPVYNYTLSGQPPKETFWGFSLAVLSVEKMLAMFGAHETTRDLGATFAIVAEVARWPKRLESAPNIVSDPHGTRSAELLQRQPGSRNWVPYPFQGTFVSPSRDSKQTQRPIAPGVIQYLVMETNANFASQEAVGSFLGRATVRRIQAKYSSVIDVAVFYHGYEDYLTGNMIAIVVTSTVLGLVAPYLVVLWLFLRSTRRYDGIPHAPKKTPFAVGVIGIHRGEALWEVLPDAMVDASTAFRTVVMAQVERHRCYALCQQIQPYAISITSRNLSDVLQVCSAAIEQLFQSDFDAQVCLAAQTMSRNATQAGPAGPEGLLAEDVTASTVPATPGRVAKLRGPHGAPRSDHHSRTALPSDSNAAAVKQMSPLRVVVEPLTSMSTSSETPPTSAPPYRVSVACMVHWCERGSVTVDAAARLRYGIDDMELGDQMWALAEPNRILVSAAAAKCLRGTRVQGLEVETLATQCPNLPLDDLRRRCKQVGGWDGSTIAPVGGHDSAKVIGVVGHMRNPVLQRAAFHGRLSAIPFPWMYTDGTPLASPESAAPLAGPAPSHQSHSPLELSPVFSPWKPLYGTFAVSLHAAELATMTLLPANKCHRNPVPNPQLGARDVEDLRSGTDGTVSIPASDTFGNGGAGTPFPWDAELRSLHPLAPHPREEGSTRAGKRRHAFPRSESAGDSNSSPSTGGHGSPASEVPSSASPQKSPETAPSRRKSMTQKVRDATVDSWLAVQIAEPDAIGWMTTPKAVKAVPLHTSSGGSRSGSSTTSSSSSQNYHAASPSEQLWPQGTPPSEHESVAAPSDSAVGGDEGNPLGLLRRAPPASNAAWRTPQPPLQLQPLRSPQAIASLTDAHGGGPELSSPLPHVDRSCANPPLADRATPVGTFTLPNYTVVAPSDILVRLPIHEDADRAAPPGDPDLGCSGAAPAPDTLACEAPTGDTLLRRRGLQTTSAHLTRKRPAPLRGGTTVIPRGSATQAGRTEATGLQAAFSREILSAATPPTAEEDLFYVDTMRTSRNIMTPHIPVWIDATLRTAFEQQAASYGMSYEAARVVVYHFFYAYRNMLKPFASPERLNIYKRLVMAFGIPQQNIVEHLAVRCAVQYLYRQDDQRRTIGVHQQSRKRASGGHVSRCDSIEREEAVPEYVDVDVLPRRK